MSRTTYLFIDYENVSDLRPERIDAQTSSVVLGLGLQRKTLPVDWLLFKEKWPDRLRVVGPSGSAKNALDFVLAVELGRTVERDPKGAYVIVSKDRGFDAVVEHMKMQHKVECSRLGSIPRNACKATGPTTKERLSRLLTDLRDPSKPRPLKRPALHNTIQAAFGRGLTEQTVEKTVRLLAKEKVLTIDGEGVVRYSA